MLTTKTTVTSSCLREKTKSDANSLATPVNNCFLKEDDLRCCICFGIFYNSMNVSPCNHKFCAACILRWAANDYHCPQCRTSITSITKDHFLQLVVDRFTSIHPNLMLSEETRKEYDKQELQCLQRMHRLDESFFDEDSHITSILTTFHPDTTFERNENDRRMEVLRQTIPTSPHQPRTQQNILTTDQIHHVFHFRPGVLPTWQNIASRRAPAPHPPANLILFNASRPSQAHRRRSNPPRTQPYPVSHTDESQSAETRRYNLRPRR